MCFAKFMLYGWDSTRVWCAQFSDTVVLTLTWTVLYCATAF